MKLYKLFKLGGATVIKFDCRGCMASDHRFEWIGFVDSFEQANVGTMAKIKIVKRNGPVDCRDEDLGYEFVAIEDTCLQELANKLWMVTK